MKKMLFGFLTIFVLVISSYINSSYANVSIPVTNNLENRLDFEKFELKLGNVTNLTDSEIISKINSFLEKKVKPLSSLELNCVVKVTATISVGSAQFKIEVTVSGPCSEMAKSGKMIADMVLAQVKARLK